MFQPHSAPRMLNLALASCLGICQDSVVKIVMLI